MPGSPAPQHDVSAERRESLTDKAVRHFEDLIFSGRFESGAALPSEAELSAELGISRLTVREAVRTLSARGLVDIHQGRRPTVASPNAVPISGFFSASVRRDPRALLDLLDVRMALEVHASRLAATHATRADVTALELCLDSMERAGDDEALNVADVRFHAALAAATGNRMIGFLVEGMEEPLHTSRLQSLRGSLARAMPVEGLLDEHRAVLAAVRDRDPDRAAAAMRRHLTRTRDDLRAALSGARPATHPDRRPDRQEQP